MRIVNNFRIYSLAKSINEAMDPKDIVRMKKDLRVYCEEAGSDFDEVCKMLKLKPSGLSKLTTEQITILNKAFGDKSWDFDETTGKIDIGAGYNSVSNKDLFPGGYLLKGIEFGKCFGTLKLSNLEIKSLKGLPNEIMGDFDISNNMLENLADCPQIIKGSFSCTNSNLNSLKGGPTNVRSGYNISNNNLESLEGSPEIVDNFDCDNNNLKTLKDGPKEVNYFSCNSNKLKTLEGFPEIINGYRVQCKENQLYTLEGLPLSYKHQIYATKNLFPEDSLKQVFYSAQKWDSWVAAYLVLITTKRFQRMGKDQRDPIRLELSGDVIKDKALSLSSIWKDPILQDPAIQRILKKTNMSQEFKTDVELGADLKDIGF